MQSSELGKHSEGVELTNCRKMSNAVGVWIKGLESYPGWREWKQESIKRTLLDEDIPLPESGNFEEEFVFSDDVERQHAVVFQYLGLEQTINSLKDCEFYFRRYPFRGLPISRSGHFTNICEMYFGRFYELKERFKKYFKAITAVAPHHALEIGLFIKTFDKVFDVELRERNSIHHHARFEDSSIDRVFLTGSITDKGWEREHNNAYRKLAREWVERVRQRGVVLDRFLDETAKATLETCSFLKL